MESTVKQAGYERAFNNVADWAIHPFSVKQAGYERAFNYVADWVICPFSDKTKVFHLPVSSIATCQSLSKLKEMDTKASISNFQLKIQ